MWKPIKINEKSHFLLTTIEGNSGKCVLHDFHEWWSCRLSLDELFKQAKACNKRIQYDEEIVRETLQSNEPELITVNENGEDKNLKLKYRVNQRPFWYEWCLQRQTEEEMHKLLLIPLFNTVCEMSQRLDELREVISKKDYELKQYKVEFQLLRRTTVQTEPFDFPQFDSQRAATQPFVEGCQKMLQHLELQYPSETKQQLETSKTPTKQKCTEQRGKSPRERKRKLLEEEKRLMLHRMEAKQKKLTYIESQSQSLDGSQEESVGVDGSLNNLGCKEVEMPYFDDIPKLDAVELPTTSNAQSSICKVEESTHIDTKGNANALTSEKRSSPQSERNASCSEMSSATPPAVKREDSLLDLDLTREFQELGEIVDRLKNYNKQT